MAVFLVLSLLDELPIEFAVVGAPFDVRESLFAGRSC